MNRRERIKQFAEAINDQVSVARKMLMLKNAVKKAALPKKGKAKLDINADVVSKLLGE